MTKRTRWNHIAAFKAKVALAAVKGERAGFCLAASSDKVSGEGFQRHRVRADALCAVARRDWPPDQRREIARYRTRRADIAALLVSAGISDERLRRTAAAKRQPLLGGDRAEGGYVGQDAVLPRRTEEPSSGDAGCREHQRDSFTTRYQVPCVRRAQRCRTGRTQAGRGWKRRRVLPQHAPGLCDRRCRIPPVPTTRSV